MDQVDQNISPEFRKERYEWLRAKTQLDLMSMDDEVMEISVLLQEAGEHTATAIERRDRAKEELQHAAASLAHAIRENPDGKRRSETAIESIVPLYPEYREKVLALDVARLDAALWSSLTDALRSKSMAIRVAADLLNSGFITPDYIRNKRRKEIREAVPVK